jgi:hypothetical protein
MWTLNAGNHTTKAVPTYQGRVPNRVRVYSSGNGWLMVPLLAYCQLTRTAWYELDGLDGPVTMIAWDG